MRKTNYAPRQGQSGSNGGVSKSNLKKITGLFKTEQGKGYEVRINEDILAALSGVKVGDYLKVFENESSKTGKSYLSLSVKPVSKKA